MNFVSTICVLPKTDHRISLDNVYSIDHMDKWGGVQCDETYNN